jgi:hypothetical protein
MDGYERRWEKENLGNDFISFYLRLSESSGGLIPDNPMLTLPANPCFIPRNGEREQ